MSARRPRPVGAPSPAVASRWRPLALTSGAVEFDWEADGISVRATAATTGPTGVEMEALTAASVALLTLYDMAKALDRAMVLGDIRLLEKSGGRSGDWRAA